MVKFQAGTVVTQECSSRNSLLDILSIEAILLIE